MTYKKFSKGVENSKCNGSQPYTINCRKQENSLSVIAQKDKNSFFVFIIGSISNEINVKYGTQIPYYTKSALKNKFHGITSFHVVKPLITYRNLLILLITYKVF